jgi:Domain of unknown function (DUF1929)/IPT/TIG domain
LKASGVKRGIYFAVLLLLILAMSASAAMAQVNVKGQWNTLSYLMPINPIHVAMMHNGKVLLVAGSGNDPSNTKLQAAVWDPQAGTITVQNTPWDMFCNGMVVLPDGRPFIVGGTLQYDPFFGQPKSAVFDPSNNTFTVVQNMAHGRWYPSVTTLGDGRVMTFSGSDDVTGATNSTVEIYTVGSGWSTPYSASWTPPLYPRMNLLPSGKVFYSGSSSNSRLFDPSAHTWTNVANTILGSTRTYGSSVLLPLTPANNYDPKVIIMGGGSPATKTTETIDLGSSNPSWQQGPQMSQERIEMNAVILPNGKVLALGGSLVDEDTDSASLNADLYDPASNSFSTMAPNNYARLYHSNAWLLPDATVAFVGGNPERGTYEQHIEIYKPPYLFNSSGNSATRPTISSAPSTIGWTGAFTVSTPDAGNISSVVLARAGAPTHAFDMDQRLVGLSFIQGSGMLTVTGPPNGNIAPPGYYMLFLLNSSGVPSVAAFVQVNGTSQAPAPTVSAITPTSGPEGGGTGVTIKGTGFQAGASVKLGGTAATGVTVASSTSITATTASHGSGTVSVVVTNPDNQSGTLTSGYTYSVVNPPPSVNSIAPNSGTINGGTAVTISGSGFLAGASVKMGGTSASGVTVVSSTSITVTAPSHAAGAVSVVVTNSDNQSDTLTNGYTYLAPAPTVTSLIPTSGTINGGTNLNITGTGFQSGATVQVAGMNAGSVNVVSSTLLTATAPAHAAGTVSIAVTNTDGQSGTLNNAYTYIAPVAPNPAPVVTSITPNSGTVNGGTGVNISGTGFLAGATVSFGGSNAAVTAVNSTSITATTPAHAAGIVSVVVTNTDQQSSTLGNGYTYSSPSNANLGLSLAPGDPKSITVNAGESASDTLSIGGEGMGGMATLTCTGAPLGAVCSVPASQAFNSSAPTTFGIKVTTTSRTMGALHFPASPVRWSWSLALTMLGVVVMPGLRAPRKSRKYLRLAPLALLLLLASCGGGGAIGGGNTSPQPQPNPNGTPAGTYTLSITATSGSAVQATALTLIVK